MAEIDPLVAEVLLKGDDEFLARLKSVGEEGVENFEKLSKAVENGATSFQAATGALGLIVAAISGVSAATIAFIEQQTELSQATELLAKAFGTTGAELQNIEQVFAASGVRVEQFERFAVRLTGTIANEWPTIAAAIRTYADENDAAQLRVQNAMINVQEAQNRLGDNSAERASRMSRDNDAIASSYIKLQFAAEHASAVQVGAAQAVNGANLSLLAAQQRLNALQGLPPSPAEQQSLQIAQAQQAVDQARQAQVAALTAQKEKAAEADLKQRQMEQEYDDLARKAAQNARDDAMQRQKDENAVREAIIARGEAEERATQFALKNVGSIRSALDGILSGNKAAATAIDLTQVSVENLKQGFIAVAAESAKAIPPTGFEALRAAAKLLRADVEGLINPQQRLRLVTQLAGSSMQSLGVSAAEILNVIEHDSAAFEELAKRAQDVDHGIDQSAHVIEDFRSKLSSLELTISQLSQAFAAAIAPGFTAFLQTITESLRSNDGLLHAFIDGIKTLGQAIYAIGAGLVTTIEYFAKLFGFSNNQALTIALIGIGTAITAALGPIGAMIVAITAIVTAVGYVRDHWDQITAAVQRAWNAIKDTTIVRVFEAVLMIIGKIIDGLNKIDQATSKLPKWLGGSGADSNSSSASGSASEGGNVQGHADGGMIRGPGSGTSDSILSRLSNGEFVIKAAAVSAYGAGLFHALNNMQLPGFASGGLVASPVRLGGGSGVIPATSTLNLSIDGRSFNGLRGPKSTIDDLSSFAIARQTSAAGNNPTWYK